MIGCFVWCSSICGPQLPVSDAFGTGFRRSFGAPCLRQLSGRTPLVLLSSVDDDPEMIDDNGDNDMVYAPTSERESYISEAEQAVQANQLAAAQASTTRTTRRPSAIELPEEISNSFLQYALSIIMGRAIPDARDGLKPVHRRILYAMDRLSLYPTTSHRKCARVVGEVLGKFHPHGDMAVYDALVRLAQDFSTHYRLIDGHGNFGSVDADPAAAMRYTECRLTSLSHQALLQDLNDDTVDYTPNFDGSELEPSVLPARLPILLLNGASGIAVGMATNVPPHNLQEIMRACTAFVKARKLPPTTNTENAPLVSDEQLFSMVPAPDFPTGATILGTEGAHKLYRTSNGGVILRATTRVEKVVASSSYSSASASSAKSKTNNKKSGSKSNGMMMRNAIIVTELPYQVNKAALLEKIAQLVNEKKLEGISDLRDESDREGIRVVIELKRDAEASVVLNNLYKKTPLQTTFSGNFLALMTTSSKSSNNNNHNKDHDDATTSSNNRIVPQRFTLRQAIDCFLDFRFETMRRKARYQRTKVEARRHVVQGLIMALTKVDEVIEIIRSAVDPKAARETLMERLGTSVEQTDAIMNLQLGQLSRLSQTKLSTEQQDLEAKLARLTTLIEVDNAVYDEMIEEFQHMVKTYGTERKTQILSDQDGELTEINLVKNARSVIVVTRGGYIKRMPAKTFESQGRGTRGKRGTTPDGKDNVDNEIAQCFTCNDHDMLLMVTQRGIAYGIHAYQVPTGSRTAKGQPIPSVLPIKASDTITTVLPVSNFDDDAFIVLATEQGRIKKTPLQAFEKLSVRGLVIASLENNDRLNWCLPCRDCDDILLGTTKGMAIRLQAGDLTPTGRNSRGLKAMTLRDGDSIADMNVLTNSGNDSNREEELVLMITSSGYGKRVPTSEFLTKRRGNLGVVAIKFKKGRDDDRLCCLRSVRQDDEILVTTEKGIMVRQKVSEIASQGRTATGVLIQKLDDGDCISSVGVLPEPIEETSNAR